MSTQIDTTPIEIPIAKRRSNKAILTGIGLILFGITLYILSTAIRDTTSSFYMLCVVSGFVVSIVGILKFIVGGKEIIYLPTKSLVRSYTLYFEALSGDELVRLIEQSKFNEIRTAKRKESGPVRLDVQRSRDNRFIALQVMQYVPYTYENVSGTYRFEGEQATTVADCIGNPAK